MTLFRATLHAGAHKKTRHQQTPRYGNTKTKKARVAGLLAGAALTLSACVSPQVVQKTTVDEQNLTCDQIKTQLEQLATIREEAAKGQTASGANVAAAILFWPAVIGNYQNAKQALEAANARNDVLVALANEKRCRFNG